jgi:predicted enzyme related to lactoylglutathione lyase
MKIKLTSVYVDDQEKALEFYTEVLGFELKQDLAMGEFRWLTLVSPDDPDGVELVLEPNQNPATQAFQQALYRQKIPFTAFHVSDLTDEYERLMEQGVRFTMEPTDMGMVSLAIFDDTCGNLIQLYENAVIEPDRGEEN